MVFWILRAFSLMGAAFRAIYEAVCTWVSGVYQALPYHPDLSALPPIILDAAHTLNCWLPLDTAVLACLSYLGLWSVVRAANVLLRLVHR